MSKVRRTGGQAVGRLAAIAALVLAAGAVQAQETSLTIYQDGSVLVRRTLPAIARGAASLSFDLASQAIEPGSFVLLADGATLRNARLVQLTGAAAALRRMVGRDLDFLVQQEDTSYYVRGRLLSTEPLAVRINDRVMYDLPGRPAFPDSVIQLAPRAELSVAADRAVPRARVAYLTSGLRWRAQVNMIVPRVGGGPAEVSGVAVLENQGLEVRGAEVQLASGTIRRVSAPRPPVPMAAQRMRMEAVAAESDAPVGDEAVGETRVYTLPDRLDLERGVTLSTALFPRSTAQVEQVFTIHPSGGVAEQWVDRADSNMHPGVTYRVRRAEGTPFGAVAVPQAAWRLFAPDAEGRLQLLGEEHQGATPAGRDVEITTGTATDVVADRIQTFFERREERGVRRVEQEVVSAFRVTVRNSKDESITVNVLEQGIGRWEVLNSTVPAERISSSQFRFALPVAARSTAVLEYRVRSRW